MWVIQSYHRLPEECMDCILIVVGTSQALQSYSGVRLETVEVD